LTKRNAGILFSDRAAYGIISPVKTMDMSIAAVIPAYRPDARLSERIAELREEGFARIVVVDDGSGPECRAVFDATAAVDGCTVLRLEANKGKGAALKTAFSHLLGKCPEVQGVVTADADGQHAPEDCRRVAEALAGSPRALVLGTRDFRLRHVPFRSWWGNVWTSLFFSLLYFRRVPDTQTGLRAFGKEWLARLADVPGSGYEYEMAMLCRWARSSADIVCVPIRTIYADGNSASHFKPLRDTFRIYGAVLSNLFSSL